MKKRIVGILYFTITCIGSLASAQSAYNNLHIIPKAGTGGGDIVNAIGSGDGGNTTVIERYNEQASKIAEEGDLGKAFLTGVMNRDTLFNYAVYFIRFLNQVGILIGGLMVLFAGYRYATDIFLGQHGDGKKTLINAIEGILIIIFSYAIYRGLTALFL